MSFFSRLTNVWRSNRLDEDLGDELQFHLDERTRQLMDDGLTPEEAAREARRRFGSALRVREESRDIKLLPWLESITRDLRLGARMMRKYPFVTAAAVLSLGLALGGC